MPSAAALALVSVLGLAPGAEHYTFPSFPRALQAKLPKPREADALWPVWRMPAGPDATLWAIGEGCGPERCRRTLLFLRKGAAWQPLGSPAGTLEDAAGGDDGPPTLTVRRPRRHEVDLVWEGGAYAERDRTDAVVDPVSGNRLTREALDKMARDDFVAGRDLSAAGRWAVLCKIGCSASQSAEEGRAALRAGLLPQATRALRAALERQGGLTVARLDLGEALAAAGKVGEARAQYAQVAAGADEKLAAIARERLAKLPAK